MRLRAIPSLTLIAMATAGACADGADGPSQELDPLGAAGNAGSRASGGSAGVVGTGGSTGGNATLATGGVSTGGLSAGGTSAGGTATAGGASGNVSGGQAGTGTGGSGGSSFGGGSSAGGSSAGGSSAGGSSAGGSSAGGKATGGSATGGVAPTVHPPAISNGQNAWASRYWDCCKPACGWQGNVRSGGPMVSCNKENQSLGDDFEARNACEQGGSAFMCWNGAPWSVSDKLSLGFAAASGPNYVCGRCFQLQFTGSGHDGNNAGVGALNGKTMIVQVINNGGVAQDQFDLLIPGGGVGLLNACSNQWGSSDLGAQYGGFLRGCNNDVGCTRNKCQQVFGNKPELMAGCEWFLGWYNAADNPNVVYKQIACPQELTARSGLGDPG